MKFKIAQVVVGLPIEGPFDYSVGENSQRNIAVGQRVCVSFNRHHRVGFVVGLKQESSFKELKEISSLLDNRPVLDDKDLKFTKSFSDYYGCSWGEAIETYLPSALRKNKSYDIPLDNDIKEIRSSHSPLLVHEIGRGESWSFIIEQIEKVVREKRSVILLVPEISQIQEIVSKINQTLSCRIAVLDKKITLQEELAHWIEIKQGHIPVIIGTRSAIFSPATNLGLIIIVDEEHDAYKQEQSPHYRVHELAQMRAKLEKCRLIFISSAPLAETWERFHRGQGQRLDFKENQLADMQIVDMTNYNPLRSSILSFPLQNSIQRCLEQKGNVLLFMNRKGFSTLTRCSQCGLKIKCPRCDVNLIYLYSKKNLVCRYCNFKTKLPKFCPHCQSAYLRSTGMGTEKLESEVIRFYPQARVSHYDKESKGGLPKADIIIATQAVLKTLKPAAINLIAVVNFDAQLNHPDFRSAHKAFSLLIHLRQFAIEKLVVQTRMVDSYCLKAAQKLDFISFYREELKLRKGLGLPPYNHLVSIGLRGREENHVFEQSKILFDQLEHHKPKRIEILDPHPDIIPKLRDKYRYIIMLKGKSIKKMVHFAKTELKKFKRKRNIIVTINVDP